MAHSRYFGVIERMSEKFGYITLPTVDVSIAVRPLLTHAIMHTEVPSPLSNGQTIGMAVSSGTRL